MEFQISNDLVDDDYEYIVSEVLLNYSMESIRKVYFENKAKIKERVSDDMLREAGYSEDDIANRTD